MISPRNASGSSAATIASWEALITQITEAGSTRRPFAMFGSATLTIEPSSTAMVRASASVAKAQVRSRFGRPSEGVILAVLGRRSTPPYNPAALRSRRSGGLARRRIDLRGGLYVLFARGWIQESQMIDSSKIREHMQVIGAEGAHV